jgi:hypothetical protein
MVMDQNALTGGRLRGAKRKVYLLRPLACAVVFQHGIERFLAAVAADADLRAGGAREVIVLQRIAVPEEPIGLAIQGLAVLVDIVLAVVHAFLQGAAQRGIHAVEVELLAGFQADAGETFAQ